MTYEETAALLYGMLDYWPNLFRGGDPTSIVQSWSASLKDVQYAAAKKGCEELSKTAKFPPSVAEVMKAAEQFMPRKIESFDVLLSRTCHDCLGFDTPLYKQMQQGHVKEPKRLNTN